MSINRARFLQIETHVINACAQADKASEEVSKAEKGCLRDFRARLRCALKELRTDFPEYMGE